MSFALVFIICALCAVSYGRDDWFKQYTCSDPSDCEGCSPTTFQQHVCLPAVGGGSANTTCFDDQIYIMYYGSPGCTGSATTQVSPVGECLTAPDGTHFYFECPDDFGVAKKEKELSQVSSIMVPATLGVTSKQNFTQFTCSDAGCLFCSQLSFTQGACLSATGGGSAVAYCDTFDENNEIIFYVYSSPDCSGQYQTQFSYVNSCMWGNSSAYVEYSCPMNDGLKAPPKLRSLHKGKSNKKTSHSPVEFLAIQNHV